MTIAVFLSSLLGAMALGMPIAFALLVCGLALMWHLDMFDTQILAQNLINGADNFPFLGQVNAASGTWVQLSGSFTVPANCTEVTLFLNQNGGSTFPDMYVDDLVALPVLP